MNNPSLFDEFPQVSSKQWKQKIQYDLKGADYNETLVWESLEGIKVKPYYHSEDVESLKSFQQKGSSEWKVGQPIYAGNFSLANTKAIDSLERGAESLVFTIPDQDLDIATLFQGIDLSKYPLHLNFETLDKNIIQEFLEFLKGKSTSVFFHLDLIGHLGKTGNWYQNLEKDHQLLEEVCAMVSSFDNFSVLSVDISHYQNSGANMVQQLAYGLAHANEYLNHFFNSASTSSKETFPITFKASVGSNYFFEIAKLRALRWLWRTLAKTYDITSDCHILAFPTQRNKTLYDYNVNMLRSTSECMSAVLGGADTVHNQAYDVIYHKDNEFGDRIARNQLLLLKDESYFGNGAKAASGSYYVESLTQQLAEKALVLFKQLESAGGFLSELKKGNIQRKIKESAEKEQGLFNDGNIVLLGTNKFQNPQDRMKDDMELYPFVKTHARKTLIEPIIARRLAEQMEIKRLDDE
ncbi:methylmalonyl-CoA mutase subunit beta [Flagellimonas sp.]|uniref:methylmalonyl-CoA mutase subunit beta n=1 Tax=Flagellimonas sp. TaxID=2058762 RepID=UPI003BB13944